MKKYEIDPNLQEENIAHQYAKKSLFNLIQDCDVAFTDRENSSEPIFKIEKTQNIHLEFPQIINGENLIPDITIFDNNKKIKTIIEIVDTGLPNFKKLKAYSDLDANIFFLFIDRLKMNSFNLDKSTKNIHWKDKYGISILLHTFRYDHHFKGTFFFPKDMDKNEKIIEMSDFLSFNFEELCQQNFLYGHFTSHPKHNFLFIDQRDYSRPITFNQKYRFNHYEDRFNKNYPVKTTKWLNLICSMVKDLKVKHKDVYFSRYGKDSMFKTIKYVSLKDIQQKIYPSLNINPPLNIKSNKFTLFNPQYS